MANAYTGTSAMSNLVKAAYDRYVEFALRSQPMFRDLADKRPVQQAMPGSSVVFSLYQDLAAATTALTETVDPDAVAVIVALVADPLARLPRMSDSVSFHAAWGRS